MLGRVLGASVWHHRSVRMSAGTENVRRPTLSNVVGVVRPVQWCRKDTNVLARVPQSLELLVYVRDRESMNDLRSTRRVICQ